MSRSPRGRPPRPDPAAGAPLVLGRCAEVPGQHGAVSEHAGVLGGQATAELDPLAEAGLGVSGPVELVAKDQAEVEQGGSQQMAGARPPWGPRPRAGGGWRRIRGTRRRPPPAGGRQQQRAVRCQGLGEFLAVLGRSRVVGRDPPVDRDGLTEARLGLARAAPGGQSG